MQYDIPYIADKQINCQTYYLWKIIQKKEIRIVYYNFD